MCVGLFGHSVYKNFTYRKLNWNLRLLHNTLLRTLTLLGLGGAETARGAKMLCAAQKLLARIFSNFMTFPDFYSSKSCCSFWKNRLSNFGVINSLLTPSHKFFDYFIKREKKAAKSEKKAACILFTKTIETEPFINYIYSSTLQGNKTLSISLSKGSCLCRKRSYCRFRFLFV